MDLTTLPIFLLANLASGLTSVIPQADLRFPGRIEAAPVVEQIDRERHWAGFRNREIDALKRDYLRRRGAAESG